MAGTLWQQWWWWNQQPWLFLRLHAKLTVLRWPTPLSDLFIFDRKKFHPTPFQHCQQHFFLSLSLSLSLSLCVCVAGRTCSSVRLTDVSLPLKQQQAVSTLLCVLELYKSKVMSSFRRHLRSLCNLDSAAWRVINLNPEMFYYCSGSSKLWAAH